jgi:hypothetical protein
MKLDMLLSSLQKVRKSGPDEWVACCPAHKDKSPSMTIKVTPDTILVHCFAGCSTENILSSIGMTFDDLYPDHHRTVKPQRISARSAIECIAFEALVVVASSGTLRKRPLSQAEHQRLSLASERIQAAQEMVTL